MYTCDVYTQSCNSPSFSPSLPPSLPLSRYYGSMLFEWANSDALRDATSLSPSSPSLYSAARVWAMDEAERQLDSALRLGFHPPSLLHARASLALEKVRREWKMEGGREFLLQLRYLFMLPLPLSFLPPSDGPLHCPALSSCRYTGECTSARDTGSDLKREGKVLLLYSL